MSYCGDCKFEKKKSNEIPCIICFDIPSEDKFKSKEDTMKLIYKTITEVGQREEIKDLFKEVNRNNHELNHDWYANKAIQIVKNEPKEIEGVEVVIDYSQNIRTDSAGREVKLFTVDEIEQLYKLVKGEA